jgi:hypothetical protein
MVCEKSTCRCAFITLDLGNFFPADQGRRQRKQGRRHLGVLGMGSAVRAKEEFGAPAHGGRQNRFAMLLPLQDGQAEIVWSQAPLVPRPAIN